MANMSYCRFHNTQLDLDDCIQALEDRNISSTDERSKAKTMLLNFLEFAANEGIIQEYDANVIDELIAECEDQDE
jgi:intergrase/recombinase